MTPPATTADCETAAHVAVAQETAAGAALPGGVVHELP